MGLATLQKTGTITVIFFMKILVNYANPAYRNAQKFNSKTGLSVGNFDEVYEYGPASIDPIFYEKNKHILEQAKGSGLWLWKPYIILDALKKSKVGDVIVYSDSASHFIQKVDYLSNLPSEFNQDVIPFELERSEGEWSKRDAFVLIGVDGLGFEKTQQRLGSPIVVKVSDKSLNFFHEFLELAQDIRIIGDCPNTCGLENYPGFQSNRHDQTIFSLLSKKYHLKAFRDPSQWGNQSIGQYYESPYPQIMELTRQRFPKQAKLKYKVVRWLKKLIPPKRL
jgi:hypothetical protein